MKRPVILWAGMLSALFAACGGNGKHSLTFTGMMDVNTVRISAQTPGILTGLACEEGSAVRRGDTLALVDTEKLGYQIDQGEAQLGELHSQLASAAAQRDAARINRDNLRRKHERFAALLASNAVTRQAVDDLKTQLDAAEAQVKSAEAGLAVIAGKSRQVEAAMRVMRKQVQDAAIRAPLDGTVLVRYVEKGELAGVGTPVCDIASLGEMWTRIYIDAKNLAAIRLGQKVSLRPDGTDRTFDGVVSWISDKAEFTPKTILTEETRATLVYPAKVTVKNPEGLLKIGMPVTVVAAETK